jgi:DNA-binding winged helix-turn-helix (wHTH) protein
MTGGLSQRLWQLSEAGDPVVMLGRQHAVGEEAAFERLLQLGILLHRGREASWDVCDDCDCGADERELLWDGDVAIAKCGANRGRDEHLAADDVRSFSVDLHAFMDGVAAAMGLGRAELVAPGLWSLGMLADGRIIMAAPTRAGIRQPGLVGAIRLTHKQGTIVLVGPELSALVRGNLVEQNIHHVQPAHALLPPTGDLLLALDVARLPDGRAGRYRLALTVGTRAVSIGEKTATLPPRPFQLLHILARQHRRGKPIVSRHALLDEIFTASTAEAAVKDLVSETRRKLKQAFGDADEVAQLIATLTTAGYAINLPPLTVSVVE